MRSDVDPRRVRTLQDGPGLHGPVVYLMGRDLRAHDNWALLYALQKAKETDSYACVLFHLAEQFGAGTKRQYTFMMQGLRETASILRAHHIPFYVTCGDWQSEVRAFVRQHGVGLIVTDFSPLHEVRTWWDAVCRSVEIPVHEVDAHNLVPCWEASMKEEFAAHTFRPKVHRLYKEYSGAFPKLPKQPKAPRTPSIDWSKMKQYRTFKESVEPVTWIASGEAAAARTLNEFIVNRLPCYEVKRNDPVENVQSALSPYIRFGFISAQRVAHEIEQVRGNQKSKDAFLEELIVRRELAENLCFYNAHYNSYNGLRDWAKRTLDAHRHDEREYLYTFEEFESANTHDELWNAAQMEMVKRGKMHGYMRMYWAKKILEWSKTPEEAIETAITLNDRYELDGRDPNGYVGVLWSIGGIHDRPWSERPVFGKIRYMNYNGCKRKFNVAAYIDMVNQL